MSLVLLLPLAGCRNVVDRNADAALRADLFEMRKAIEQYVAEKHRYPEHLSTLVPKYLRHIPVDPITHSASTWIEVRDEGGGVADVRSGAAGKARDGTPYGSL